LIQPRQKLVKSSRLRCSEDFKQTFHQGYRIRQGCLTAYAKSNDLCYARLGLAVAKKIIPNATSRSRIKRIIRESFRLNQALLGGLDIVVVVNEPCFSSDKQGLSYDLNKQWLKLVHHFKNA